MLRRRGGGLLFPYLTRNERPHPICICRPRRSARHAHNLVLPAHPRGVHEPCSGLTERVRTRGGRRCALERVDARADAHVEEEGALR